ncbi:MAG: hypothetical protein JXB04_06995 [Kiritimatiellae bacterium]|nr:hypothetical protein [Kiritimatiellia bacterium]
MKRLRWIARALLTVAWAAGSLAATPGSDDASDAAYGGGWTNGANGGYGFDAWALAAEQGSGFAGHFLANTNANSALNYIQTGPDGEAWGVYANGAGNNIAVGFRGLGGALAVDQSVRLCIEHKYITAAGAVGFTLRTGNAVSGAGDYTTGARVHFGFVGGSNNYFIVDGTSGGDQFDTGIPWTENGLRIWFSLKTLDTYDLNVLRLGPGGGVSSFTGRTLAGVGNIESLAVYAEDVDVGSEDGNVYFNSLVVRSTSLIRNGDFEEHSGSWNTWSNWLCWGTGGTLEQGYYRSATTCSRTWYNDSGLQQDFPASPGVEYTADAYLFTPTGDEYGWDAGSNTYACVRLEFKDSGDGDLGYVESAPFTPDDPVDIWTYCAVTGAAPQDTAYGRIILGIRGAPPGAGTVAFDDASVIGDASALFVLAPTVLDGGGTRLTNTGLQVIDGSIGGLGGVLSSNVPGGDQVAKHGYAGQLYDLAGIQAYATPTTIDESASRQLGARWEYDDLTVDPLDGEADWRIVDGPLASISVGGLATASNVYEDTAASAQAQYQGYTDLVGLLVLNINWDNWGLYAADGVDDAWQVRYFGETNPDGLGDEDPDLDDDNNREEWYADTIPTDSNSYFRLTGMEHTNSFMVSFVCTNSREYSLQYATNMVDGSWLMVDGATNVAGVGSSMTLTDAVDAVQRSYRVGVSLP